MPSRPVPLVWAVGGDGCSFELHHLWLCQPFGRQFVLHLLEGTREGGGLPYGEPHTGKGFCIAYAVGVGDGLVWWEWDSSEAGEELLVTGVGVGNSH